jgi:hypothetical protein
MKSIRLGQIKWHPFKNSFLDIKIGCTLKIPWVKDVELQRPIYVDFVGCQG